MADPKSFGRYQVKQLLGRGAMGVVYLAEDPVITRKVAIKVISSQPGQADSELQARFEREFRSAGTLSHPNIVTIHDVGKQGTRTFIAMEYVEGKSLEDIANLERCMPLETVASLLDQICSGLDYAHERSIVHRDIKPANIIVTPDGRAKITDFGVAKVLDLTTTGVTQEGATIGTPSYMSPEQAKGYRVKGSADQFSVAVMVYRLLTGERPFMGDSRSTVMYKIVHEDPITLNVLNRTIPAGVSTAVMKALGKDPTQRFPTCSAFAAAVRVGMAGGTVNLGAGARGLFRQWFLLDTDPRRVVVFADDTRYLTTLAGNLEEPVDLATDSRGRVYVLDQETNSVVRFDADGSPMGRVVVGTWGRAQALDIDELGHLYILDRDENEIHVFSQTGQPLEVLGPQLPGGVELRDPRDLAVDGTGRLYIADRAAATIVILE